MGAAAAAGGSQRRNDSFDKRDVSTSSNSEDVNKYDVTHVLTFELPASRTDEAKYETIDDCDDSAMLELDERLIDYDMLMMDNEEADRIY